MAKIDFYVSGTSETDNLTERYGECLEDMSLNSLLTFRAVVDLFALYFARDLAGTVERAFDLAVESAFPEWGYEDEEAYTRCRAFCLENVDGEFVAIRWLNPMVKALTDSIQHHIDY